MMENNLGGKKLTSGSGEWLPKKKKKKKKNLVDYKCWSRV